MKASACTALHQVPTQNHSLQSGHTRKTSLAGWGRQLKLYARTLLRYPPQGCETEAAGLLVDWRAGGPDAAGLQTLLLPATTMAWSHGVECATLNVGLRCPVGCFTGIGVGEEERFLALGFRDAVKPLDLLEADWATPVLDLRVGSP